MKLKTLIAMIVATGLTPSLAYAAEGGEAGGSWLMFAFFAINFTLFVFILMRFGAPAARGFFSDRAKGIRTQLARLESAFNQAQDHANRAASRMAKLDDEIARLKADMDAETALQASRIREGAKSTADRIRYDTQMSEAAIADAARRGVRAALAAAAANLARSLIVRSFQPSDQARLVEGFIERLREESAR